MAIGRRSGKMSAIETICERAIASESAIGHGHRVSKNLVAAVFELAAHPHNLDDFTLWNNDGPIIVEKDLFFVSAVQGRALERGERWGWGILRERTRARVWLPWRSCQNSSGCRAGICSSPKNQMMVCSARWHRDGVHWK